MSSSNGNSAPPPGERFKRTLISLANMMSVEMDKARNKGVQTISKAIIDFGIELIKNADGDIIIGGFVTRSFSKIDNTKGEEPSNYINFWDKIKERDTKFFLDSQNSSLLFGEISKPIVDGFINLIKNKHIGEQVMNSVWQHLHAMVKMSIAFVHFERKPQKINNEDGFSFKYTEKVRKYIDLNTEASKWNIDLMQAK